MNVVVFGFELILLSEHGINSSFSGQCTRIQVQQWFAHVIAGFPIRSQAAWTSFAGFSGSAHNFHI